MNDDHRFDVIKSSLSFSSCKVAVRQRASRDNYTSVIDINCLRKYVHNFLFSFLQRYTICYVCFVAIYCMYKI